MKKTITLVAALALAMGAYAQAEAGWVDVTPLPEKDKAAVPGGTVIATTANVTMSLAFNDDWGRSGVTDNEDAVNTVTIAGTAYPMPAGGAVGSSNPKESDLMHGGQNSGAVFKFDVKADGWLYVFGKIANNKSYYVWEGDVPNAIAEPVAYTLKGVTKKDGATEVSYTLPGDEEYGHYQIGMGYDTGTALYSAGCCYDVATDTENPALGSGGAGVKWSSGDLLGVIAFPVYVNPETGVTPYYVNACGSKMASTGYVFIPCDPTSTPCAEISFSKTEGEAAIESVAVDADDENAPVYNINGQEVSKDTKGLLIQKGKKFYNR